MCVAARQYGGGEPWNKPTFDILPVPKGSWQADFDRRNRYGNTMLAIGLAVGAATLAHVSYGSSYTPCARDLKYRTIDYELSSSNAFDLPRWKETCHANHMGMFKMVEAHGRNSLAMIEPFGNPTWSLAGVVVNASCSPLRSIE